MSGPLTRGRWWETQGVRYVQGRCGHKVGDWEPKFGKTEYAGYGMIRPSPNAPLETDDKTKLPDGD